MAMDWSLRLLAATLMAFLSTATAAKPIVIIEAADFSLSLAAACTATATVRATLDQTARLGSAVPFVRLYNRVNDTHDTDLEPCESLSLVHGNSTQGLLRVHAAHSYGTLDVAFAVTTPNVIVFTLASLSDWHADPVEKNLEFGEFWEGLGLANATAPVVMGKLQGPRSIPVQAGTATATAGFIALTRNTYYKWMMRAVEGDALGFSIVKAGSSSADIARRTWMAAGGERGIVKDNSNRFLSWLWTQCTEATAHQVGSRAKLLGVDIVVILTSWHVVGEELRVDPSAFPSGINATVTMLWEQYGLRTGLHMHPDIVWPCTGAMNAGVQCFETGTNLVDVDVSAMLPEGLAPTFRSGPVFPTEDLAFYWGHDPLFKQWSGSPAVAHNGNPQPCGQGACNRCDWPTNTWGPDMQLHNTTWSPLGVYRGGYAIGFDGAVSAGRIPAAKWVEVQALRDQLTIGMVVHPLPGGGQMQVLCVREGVWRLGLRQGALEWRVNTTAGEAVALAPTPLSTASGASYAVKATWNSTSGVAMVFVDAARVARSKPISNRYAYGDDNNNNKQKYYHQKYNGKEDGKKMKNQQNDNNDIAPPVLVHSATADVIVGADSVPASGSSAFKGALEEIYFKNVSTEHRKAYLYADDNRKLGTYLIDLGTPKGRSVFASAINGVLNQANFSALQYDGFEKLQLISARDFAHSAKTVNSGMFRGPPTADWYHYQGWPLLVGQGILQGMEETARGMAHPTAVEPSFQAPGLFGATDMMPYVDERLDRNASHHPNGYVELGQQWHTKLLLRTELSGTVVNAYNTEINSGPTSRLVARFFYSEFEVDYWCGGLIAGGVAPQLMIPNEKEIAKGGPYDTRFSKWLNLYRKYGHLREDSVQTLVYDPQCCHVQGDCEWVACQDTVAVGLYGGTTAGPVVGVVGGSAVPVTVPSTLLGLDAGGHTGGGKGDQNVYHHRYGTNNEKAKNGGNSATNGENSATKGQNGAHKDSTTLVTLVVFKAFGVPSLSIRFDGTPDTRTLDLVVVSPRNASIATCVSNPTDAACNRVFLNGDFFDIGAASAPIGVEVVEVGTGKVLRSGSLGTPPHGAFDSAKWTPHNAADDALLMYRFQRK